MFQGSMVALATPMTSSGDVDKPALEALVGFHLDNKTDAIVAMGTTGESATFSHKEHRDVVKMVIALVAGKIPVIAGTGSNSTAEALALTQAAKIDGADAVLLVSPYYNKPPQEGLFQHHNSIADRVDIPQILYNVPGRTSVDLLPETVERLSKHENIVGIKEATGDLGRAKEILDRCGNDFDLITGDDATAMEFILLGGVGDISVTANVAPALMHQMCQAALEGDRALAEELNAKVELLNSNLFVESNPIPVKWLLHKMGYGSNAMRLPLVPLAEKYQQDVVLAAKAADIYFD